MKLICYKSDSIGPAFAFLMVTMLSRREVLMVLRTMGVKEQSMLKADLRDYESYMKKNFGFEITKKGTLGPAEKSSQMMRPVAHR